MRTDVLVIGSGIAGLFFAARAAQFADVLLVTKKERPESSTNYAQGGIAAVFAPDDTPALHLRDTLVAGAGLCRPQVARVLVTEGPARVRELIELGVAFNRQGDTLSLGREGGHSRRRIVRADDLTGREIERGLLGAVAAVERIQLLENHLALDLLTARADGGTVCCGATVLRAADGAVIPIRARAVVLATGGCGQVYRHTTNPSIATGDGVAMAARAGAWIGNMEFMQFHPTALYPADSRSFLISEAVRGEGAELVGPDGSAFMHRYHPLGSLAPRDVVARAIDREMKQHGTPFVLLDCSAISARDLRSRFPNIVRETARRGIDMLRDPLPVVPAAHYLCGGVLTDAHGSTSLSALFAIGETACTGVHGANRLASNSLLEAVVFAERAAAHLRTRLNGLPHREASAPPLAFGARRDDSEEPDDARVQLRALMWELAGIVRSDEQLCRARHAVRALAERSAARWQSYTASADEAELRNLLHVAAMMIRSALLRRESRGLHFNRDTPYADNERFLADTVLR